MNLNRTFLTGLLFGVGTLLFPLAGKAGEPNAQVPLIVLKLDDMRDKQENRWQRVADFLIERKIKFGVGIICNSLEGDHPDYFERLRRLASTGYVEFWNHGYDHRSWKAGETEMREFQGTSVEHQQSHLKKSQRLAREKIGVSLTAFGAPFNATDGSTVKVLSDEADITVWLYGSSTDSAGKFVARRAKGVNLESPVHRPNFAAFKKGYEANPHADYFVVQGHPPSWEENDFTEFVRIIEFLLEKKTRFLTPSELPDAVKPLTR